MRLKLTLERPDGLSSADLMVSTDPQTTVGMLADYVIAADPESRWDRTQEHTVALSAPERRTLRRESNLMDAGLSSGAEVSIIPTEAPTAAEVDRPTVAALVVTSGPDTGREFPLHPGVSVIGRGRDCDVRLSDRMTSRRHAKIYVGDSVEVTDLGSVNGVLIGDVPVQSASLASGDTFHLGDTALCVRLQVASPVRHAVVPDLNVPIHNAVRHNRPPRVDSRYEGKKITLPDPPATPRGQRFPIIPLFAPLLMGVALYLTTRSATSLIFMAMSPLMMAGNVIEGQLAGRRTYDREMEAFTSAVERAHGDAVREAELEREGRRTEHPSLAECSEAVRGRTELFWCRRPDVPGFGELRIGVGNQPSRTTFEFPYARQVAPEIADGLRERFEPFKEVDDVPVCAALDDHGVIGVAGPDDGALSVARAYVMLLASLHSHTELSVYGICGPNSADTWEWLKWLPHCADSQAPLDCDPLVSSQPGIAALLGELEGLARRRAEGRAPDSGHLPRLLVVVDEPTEADRSRIIDLAEQATPLGIWVLWVAQRTVDLPAICKVFVEVGSHGERVAANFVEEGCTVDPLTVESLSWQVAEQLARSMSPVIDDAARDDSQSDIPRSVSLLSLVGRDLATSPDRVLERWVENRSVLTGPLAPEVRPSGATGNLRAVIGETATGPHVLDLRVHGPHALVGGTTGAGKSELLQTWIMGMALSNSPQRLTFLLVDYKGGSAFSDCVHLPHTVGLVTDLSPHLVRRALTSLSAELRFREEVLRKKRAKDLVALEREGDPEAPPSLVIVVDEFAALVREVPEFVDGVVNVAQRGRSLGLHLVLATQRPSGVIRENLRANTNLRIALRMADVPDSTDVIGSKIAASFDPSIPGRAVSRTGPTALVPFQTGYVGGWTSSETARADISVRTFGFTMGSVWEPPIDENDHQPAEGPTDIQRLVATIGDAHLMAELAEPRKPWLPELAAVYDLSKLPTRRRDDELVFAVVDDPAHQAQSTVSFRPDDDGNMAVFGTGNSGKSTVLRSLCMAAGFTVRGGPCQVYAVDFGARGLQMLEQLPHVGGVTSGSDIERVSRLFSMIRESIDKRAVRYSTVGAGSITQYRQISGNQDEARILLFIDGMGAMRTAFEGTEHHRLFENFLSIAGDGRPVGVHVVITADRAGAVPSALGAQIQRRLILRLAGENDYSMLGQPTDVLDAKSPAGRGLWEGLEVQVAVLGGTPDLLAQDLAARSFAAAMRNAGVRPAPPVRRLEDEIPLGDLEVEVDGQPVFAVAGDTLESKAFSPEGTFTIAGPPGSGRTTAVATIVSSMKRWCPTARAIYFGSKRSPLVGALEWDRVALDPAEAAQLANEVPDLLGDSAEGGRGVVVIENVVDLVQSEADAPLQDMVKRVTAYGHLVVTDGEPVPLSGIQPLLQAVRASRVGLVLQPEQTDGSLFRAQFPRLRKAEFPPGRGLYVGRGAQPVIVQVAR